MENGYTKLSRLEKYILRVTHVSAADVHKTGHNSVGTVYGLYNNCYLIEKTFNGCSDKRYIYRVLAREYIRRVAPAVYNQ